MDRKGSEQKSAETDFEVRARDLGQASSLACVTSAHAFPAQKRKNGKGQ